MLREAGGRGRFGKGCGRWTIKMLNIRKVESGRRGNSLWEVKLAKKSLREAGDEPTFCPGGWSSGPCVSL